MLNKLKVKLRSDKVSAKKLESVEIPNSDKPDGNNKKSKT
jgi:hypothetical protein